MGRHSSARARGWRARLPIVLLCAVLVLAAGWFGIDFLADRATGDDCDATTELNVTATPEIAPAIEQVGRAVSERDDSRVCYRVRVTARDSAEVAQSLVVSDGTERPDVWIPESTIWLRRATDGGAWAEPVTGTSIASSPVVLALTEDAAIRLGWPDQRPSWAQAVGPNAEQLSVGLPDPAQDPVGVAMLLGVQQLLTQPADGGDRPADPASAITTAFRELSPNAVPDSAELYERLPGTDSTEEPIEAFPATETAVLRHNARQTGTELVGAYATPAAPSMDYPYLVLPDTAPDTGQAAELFLREMVGQQTAEVLADAGFRTPDGEMLRQANPDQRLSMDKVTPSELLGPVELDRLLQTWAGINRSGRIQVLLDVSGSMNEAVPGTGKNRMTVTLEAAELGFGLMKPTTKLGIWLFSTNLDGDTDYRELLPVAPISDLLTDESLGTLRGVEAVEGGATGLYDSTLAAYRSARRNYEPGRINLVVVMTDGRNEDSNGISQRRLVDKLTELSDPRRPIQIIGIGIGTDVDSDELDTISSATGGQAFTAPDPTTIPDIFYSALSKLLCQPPDCIPAGR